jgi:hypothetical protein
MAPSGAQPPGQNDRRSLTPISEDVQMREILKPADDGAAQMKAWRGRRLRVAVLAPVPTPFDAQF